MPAITIAVRRELERLTALHSSDGGLTKQHVLNAAQRDLNSPLRDFFTWNVEDAAAERWLDQAGELLRRYRYEIIPQTSEEISVSVRMVQSPAANRGAGGGYLTTTHILSDQGYWDDMLATLRGELNALTNRFEGIAAVARTPSQKRRVAILVTIIMAMRRVLRLFPETPATSSPPRGPAERRPAP